MTTAHNTFPCRTSLFRDTFLLDSFLGFCIPENLPWNGHRLPRVLGQLWASTAITTARTVFEQWLLEVVWQGDHNFDYIDFPCISLHAERNELVANRRTGERGGIAVGM
jgi:hypothetical protein